MYLRVYQISKFAVILTILLVQQTECKRRGGGGGRRTGGGGGGGSHTTPRSNTYHQSNTGTHDDRVHQTNTYQTNSNNPSAPILPSSGNTNIGFENYNRPHGTPQGNKQDIGFENVQNRAPLQNSQSGPPIGFNVPQQNHQPSNPAGFNVPQQNYQPSHTNNGFNSPPPIQNGGYQPQGGIPNTHYQPNYNNYNPQANTGNYHPNNYNQFGGNNAFNPHLQGGGYHNPNLAQPGSYYNPHYGVPSGVPPPIYQPVQQSSGSSFLGYAGSFAGGYLIGKLTSGGGGHDSGDRQYTVHHYHHNADEVPKRTSVSNNSLGMCSQNETQGLCVPNTFPICLINGTILCVTHLPYTVPCGQNQSMSCVVTVLPCANGTNCNTTADNSTATTAVYIPCISNVTLSKPSELQNMSLPTPSNTSMNETSSNNTSGASNTTTNETQSNNKVELCITAIAEPKVAPKLQSAAPTYLNVLEKLLEFPIHVNFSTEISVSDSENGTESKSNTIYVST